MAARARPRILDAYGRPVSAASADYEAASTSRRFLVWGLSQSGPNTLLIRSLDSLRARSRDLVRNDPVINGAVDLLVSNIVGTGITPRWNIDDPSFKSRLQMTWDDWVYEADADNVLDFYGLQALVTRSVIEAGEAFVRIRPRPESWGLTVPLQLQVIEPDHIDSNFTMVPYTSTTRVIAGIEFNRVGQRVAYHVFREHPGEGYGGRVERVRVPASQMLHVYRPLRPGQIRGVPWLASTITTIRELNQYDDAELVRKKTAAMFGGFLKKPVEETEDMPSVLGGSVETPSGETVISMEPGTFPELPPGYEVTFSDPADVGGNYEAFVSRHDRRIARGLGMSYEKLTGDLSRVNYSSIRAMHLEFQRQCKQFIRHVLIRQLCHPVIKEWIRQAALSGVIPAGTVNGFERKNTWVRWTHDGWPWVDPLKDLKAAIGAIRAGLSSRTKEIAERGEDIEDIYREIANENRLADDLGLILDSDPRRTTASGKYQNTEKEDGD